VEAELFRLLDYRDVLCAVASTQDGLVVASAGLSTEDAETVAAAGSSVVQTLAESGEQQSAIDLAAGRLHLALGDELMLLVLTEADIPVDVVGPVMVETLKNLDSSVA
jgi:predicted regulator of Ras-like GTPase activity (Roadblock/LC7/MglB family)